MRKTQFEVIEVFAAPDEEGRRRLAGAGIDRYVKGMLSREGATGPGGGGIEDRDILPLEQGG